MEKLQEPQEQQPWEKTPVPPYEAWPSVPKGTIAASVPRERLNVMDLDNMMSPQDQHSRATSALSMDDIEAAHALEGLRTGTCIPKMPSIRVLTRSL